MEKLRQTILPSDDFAHEAVAQYHAENETVDGMLSETLDASAGILVRGNAHPKQLENVRGFMKRMIGFQR